MKHRHTVEEHHVHVKEKPEYNGLLRDIKIALLLWGVGFIMLLNVVYFESFSSSSLTPGSGLASMVWFFKVFGLIFTIAGAVMAFIVAFRLLAVRSKKEEHHKRVVRHEGHHGHHGHHSHNRHFVHYRSPEATSHRHTKRVVHRRL